MRCSRILSASRQCRRHQFNHYAATYKVLLCTIASSVTLRVVALKEDGNRPIRCGITQTIASHFSLLTHAQTNSPPTFATPTTFILVVENLFTLFIELTILFVRFAIAMRGFSKWLACRHHFRHGQRSVRSSCCRRAYRDFRRWPFTTFDCRFRCLRQIHRA